MPAGLPPTPWIQGADVAQHYQQGYGLGLAQQRLQQQAAETQAQMEMQQRQADVRARMEQAQMETAKAYHQAQIGLAQQKLQEAQKMNQIKAMQAAQKYAASERIKQRIAAGEDEGKVLMEEMSQAGVTPGMAAMYKAHQAATAPAPQTTWVPPDPTTGAPGYMRDPRGVPHFNKGGADSSQKVAEHEYNKLMDQRFALEKTLAETKDAKIQESLQTKITQIVRRQRMLQQQLGMIGGATGAAATVPEGAAPGGGKIKILSIRPIEPGSEPGRVSIGPLNLGGAQPAPVAPVAQPAAPSEDENWKKAPAIIPSFSFGM